MLPKDRQKMCTNCDGRIPWDAEMCPYCSANTKPTIGGAGGAKDPYHQSLQDSLTSLYTPLYGKNSSFLNQVGEKKEAPSSNKESMVEKKINYASSSLGAPMISGESAIDPSVDQGKAGFGQFCCCLSERIC